MHETLTKTREEDQVLKCSATATVSGHVRIENGDTVIEGKNKICKGYVLSLANFFLANIMSDNQATMNRNLGSINYIFNVLGTDTTTQTNNNTTALVSPIGTAPGTKNNQMTASAWTSGNAYFCQWMGTFNPGSVSGTVGEIGLYLNGRAGSLLSALSQWYWDNRYLMARFAVADSEFTAFTIDTTKPVVITWTFKWESDGVFALNLIRALANITTCVDESGAQECPIHQWTSKTTYMVLGSDTTTENTAEMTALTSPIGTAPGTKATTQSCSSTQVSEGHYKVTLTAQWNAGSISGTVGEIGLYLYGCTTYLGLGTFAAAILFGARLSNADTHFSSFSIDTAKNLIINWDIFFDFV